MSSTLRERCREVVAKSIADKVKAAKNWDDTRYLMAVGNEIALAFEAELAATEAAAYQRAADRIKRESKAHSMNGGSAVTGLGWSDLEELAEVVLALATPDKLGALEVQLNAARLDEARWWEHLVGAEHDMECEKDCMYCERIASLESAKTPTEY